MAKVIEGLYYSESHEYVKVEGGYGYIGITAISTQLLFALTVSEISARSMTGILQYPQSIFVGQLSEFFHLMRIPRKIHRNDTLESALRMSCKQFP